jgi:two-component system sensor histidine kinase KdpD
MNDQRPDPEVLLARLQREKQRAGRGTLRVYLGAFPGVGKTYAMLSEAHRRRSYGEDVVVGFVETHGRKPISDLLEGLEVLPRKRIEYRGVSVEEMDVEVVLKRHPAVCLVDELAHTNAPGSEREKRYEDVEEILDAGIKVVSTLNIQHLESLNDVVKAITGIRVRETIPDSVVDKADELILIDLSPEAARARMQHGHIYPPAQAEAALENFFRVDNLAALRELALRRTAQEVEVQLDEYMRGAARHSAADERVLVFVDETPLARTLIRHGWRLAQGLRANLLVAYLKRDLDERAQAGLSRTLELAEDLNARVCPLEGTDAVPALKPFIETEGINHLILPHHRRSALKRLLVRSPADQLMSALPHLNVHLASGQ